MPITPTYPGVYVEEIAGTTHTISGVSTSVTAFVSGFAKGPTSATQILNVGDFNRTYGGLDSSNPTTYAVQQYFANGGEYAWIVRVLGDTAALASVGSKTASGSAALTFSAANAGSWGNNIAVTVSGPSSSFSVTAVLYDTTSGMWTAQTTVSWAGLTGTTAAGGIGDANGVITAAGTAAPAPNGTWGGPISTLPTQVQAMTVTLTQPTGKPQTQSVSLPVVASMPMLPGSLQTALTNSGAAWLTSAQVTLDGSQRLTIVLTDPSYATGVLSFTGALASSLALDNSSALTNVQAYLVGSTETAGSQVPGTAGADGDAPTATQLAGDPTSRTGLYALDEVQVINILCLPSMADIATTGAYTTLVSAATAYAVSRYAMLIVDPQSTVKTLQEAQAWIAASGTIASPNNVAYWPQIEVADPLDNYAARPLPPSGTMAGLYARTDNNAGVWVAPAGVNASLKNVVQPAYRMTNAENGTLNPQAMNALRSLPIYGNVCWGARTLYGADARASEWKYVPVRRLALYIEESLLQGLQWAVFQPNGESLWGAIRLNVGSFLNGLYAQGAFKGQTPQQAYFVNCDASTTSAQDIQSGIVNVVVGFAPLVPAEFVILQIQQITGQAST